MNTLYIPRPVLKCWEMVHIVEVVLRACHSGYEVASPSVFGSMFYTFIG